MMTVIHYDHDKDPDIYFGIDQKTENTIIEDLKSRYEVKRCDAKEWPGQDNPNYAVHHWHAKRMRRSS